MKNKGFSLIELLIVITIMAILVGVIAPQFLSYVKRAKEAVAKDEVYEIVKVANIKLVETEIDGDPTFVDITGEAPTDFLEETLAEAVAKGDMESMVISNRTVTYVEYASPNGITAFYDITASPTIYVIDEETSQESTTDEYDLAKSILFGPDVDISRTIDKVTHSIQIKYAEKYNGVLPFFSSTKAGEDVAALIKENGLSISDDAFNSLKWIPSSDSNKEDVIMYAGSISSGASFGNINSASIAYYDGNYYYHHAWDENKINDVYVSDDGRFTQTFKDLAAEDAPDELNDWVLLQ